jgi:signal transduction histidine kinase
MRMIPQPDLDTPHPLRLHQGQPPKMSRSPFRHPSLWPLWLALACGVFSMHGVLAQEEPLTSAREVLDLTADEARRGLPAHVRGVVTYSDPAWAGQFFVQDDSGGVFIGYSGKNAPAVGELVDVRGLSHPGAFAPFIEKPEWSVVGKAPLPPAREISMERFASGIDDGLRVEVAGRVRKVTAKSETQWSLILSSGGHRFEVIVNPARPDIPMPVSWVGANVRLRGVLAADYQLHRRGLAMVRLYVASSDDAVVEQPEEIDPYQQELLPLARIGQYRRDLAPGQRSRVRGVVVSQLGKESLAIEDDSGGLIIRGADMSAFRPGERVEAVGFEGLEDFLPVLQDCMVSRLDEPAGLPPIARPPVHELSLGRFHACLVGVDADLIEINERPAADGGGKGRQIVMTLRSGRQIFKADLADKAAEKSPLPFDTGSRLELTGICLAEANNVGRVDSFRLHLSDPMAVRILREPPWFNQRRLRIALASALAAMTLSGLWIVSSARKNRRLKAEILEREKLTAELEQAKQKLSLRVDERTEELKLQISARKESEVRYKAIIDERTRLAQELHDGLQQGLTGVALQLDTASRLRDRSPEQSSHHLELARTLMRQTHTDLRNSVWNLRSRGREDFSLLEALRQSGERLTDGTGVSVEVIQTGEPRPLSELQEENLLRIAQEGLTNAIKHSGSKRIEIHLAFSPSRLVLRVRDFGSGFSPEQVAGPAQGHFGLSGMSERAQRIGGSLRVHGDAGQGTLIEAELPLPDDPETITD